jgi:hypothetical protein
MPGSSSIVTSRSTDLLSFAPSISLYRVFIRCRCANTAQALH